MQSSDQMHRTPRYVAIVGALALLPVSGALATPRGHQRVATEVTNGSHIEKGIITTVGRHRLRLRALDGSTQWIVLAARAAVRVNDVDSLFGDIRPGFGAEVSLGPKGKALRISAYGTVPLTVDRGVIETSTSTSLTLRTASGRLVLVSVGPATQITVNGALAPLEQLIPGTRIAVGHRGAAPAERIRAVMPPVPVPAQPVVDRGRVTAIDAATVTIRRGRDGAVVTTQIDSGTQVEGGVLASITTGSRIAVRHLEGGPATLITILHDAGSP